MNITSKDRMNMFINNNHLLKSLEMYDDKFLDERLNLGSVKNKLRNISKIPNNESYIIKSKELNNDILHILDIISKNLDSFRATTTNDVRQKNHLNSILNIHSRNLHNNNKINKLNCILIIIQYHVLIVFF